MVKDLILGVYEYIHSYYMLLEGSHQKKSGVFSYKKTHSIFLEDFQFHKYFQQSICHYDNILTHRR